MVTTQIQSAAVKIPIFKREDVNGIIYIVTSNIASFIIIISTLSSIGWSSELIYGKALPGICFGMLLSGFYYSWMAYRLAKKEGRTNVTALPFGLSTPALMVYLYSVIMPLQFGLNLDPETTWKCAMAATVVGGVIEAIGGFIGPFIRRHIPRTAMLATVSGISLVWMGTLGMFDAYNLPLVGIPVLVAGMFFLIGGYNLPKKIKIPPLVLMMVFSIALGLLLKASHIDTTGLGTIVLPGIFPAQIAEGLKLIFPVLVAIIPVEIYNFVETMDNVESAIACGDSYNVKEAQIVDGICTAVGGLFGGIAPNTVWLGHNGLKKSGCGVGHAWVSGIIMMLFSVFGVFRFIYALIPAAYTNLFILWIAMVALTQAFVDTPRRYGAAIVIALIPHLADILYNQTNAALYYFGAELSPEVIEGMVVNGAMWSGLEVLKNGGILVGMIWATIVCAIVDRQTRKAMVMLIISAVLAFFGVIHGTVIGINVGDPLMILGYLVGALICFLFYLGRNKLEIDRRYDYI